MEGTPHVLGIRHHGPGSAKALLKALRRIEPDLILIESPSDADSLLQTGVDHDMKPPVAIVVYQPNDFSRASYLPFATFSPEWQAIQFGLRNATPCHFIDLPLSIQFGLSEQVQAHLFAQPGDKDPLRSDPLGYLASVAGYTDSERWWEVHFELLENDASIFDRVGELMAVLREELKGQESAFNLLREAYMRLQIRSFQKKGYKNIVVVCGAWHVPGLTDPTHTASKDRSSLKGLKKIKTHAAWIPWNHERLSKAAGYGAGVISPAWYHILFQRRKQATVYWMSRAARLLRKEGLLGSSATAVHAVQLAEMLATIREIPIPGIQELKEAALSTLCQGNSEIFSLIEKNLVIGQEHGKLGAGVQTLPIQKDLESRIKKARLSSAYQHPEVIHKSFDLRKPTQLEASKLLHRLRLLSIYWGELKQLKNQRLGSFHEDWRLEWKPTYHFRLIEASTWGTTIEEAVRGKVIQTLSQEETLSALAQLLHQVLQAALPDLVDHIVQRLQAISSRSTDVLSLVEALPFLTHAQRYGNVRQTAQQSLSKVIEDMVPRILIGLPGLCSHIDDEFSIELLPTFEVVNHTIKLLENQDFLTSWRQTLLKLVDWNATAARIRGITAKVLFDNQWIDTNALENRLSAALSPGMGYDEGAKWLDGLLRESGLLLIHHPQLFQVLDHWLSGLDPTSFKHILPLLRRTFADFAPAEKGKILGLAKGGRMTSEKSAPSEINWDQVQPVWDQVRQFIGE